MVESTSLTALTYPGLAVLIGLVLLIYSANLFVAGAATLARNLGMSPLLIGMLILGFGTSAPELLVSGLAAADGSPELALGNAFGSNIANIGLILGLTAILSPIAVHSKVLIKELPILAGVSALTALLLWNGTLGQREAAVLLIVFIALVAWSARQDFRGKDDPLVADVNDQLDSRPMSNRKALVLLISGLVVLIASSRALVWGATQIAATMGVSDLLIGLTVVAVGTSLPELAASIVAVRRREHELVLGNVLGSNLFNTLAVIGLAGAIAPMSVPREALTRDLPVMAALTLSLFVIGFRFRGPGRVNRLEGVLLVTAYVAYTAWLIATAT